MERVVDSPTSPREPAGVRHAAPPEGSRPELCSDRPLCMQMKPIAWHIQGRVEAVIGREGQAFGPIGRDTQRLPQADQRRVRTGWRGVPHRWFCRSRPAAGQDATHQDQPRRDATTRSIPDCTLQVPGRKAGACPPALRLRIGAGAAIAAASVGRRAPGAPRAWAGVRSVPRSVVGRMARMARRRPRGAPPMAAGAATVRTIGGWSARASG